MLVGFLIKCTGTLIELALPYILSHILDDVVPNDGRLSMIILWGGGMIACSLIALVCNVKANRMASKVARDCTEQIRHDLFYRTMTLSGRQIDAFTVPSLESRITTDTYNVQDFIGKIQRLGVRAPLLLLGGIIVTLVMDPFLSLVMLAVLPVIFAVVYFVSLWGVRLYKNVQKSVDGMIRVVREDSQGIRVIKALSRVEREHQRYDKVNKKLVSDEKKANLTLGFVNPVMNLLMNLGITFVVLLGAYRVMGRKTDPGVIIAFTQYFTMISTATLSITRIFMMYTRSTASAARIQQVVDAPRELTALSEADYPIKEENGYIVFENVSFSYGGKGNHLKNISFSLPRGQTLGIIGGTGSGKTTLINLLMRIYDINSGSIRIGGRQGIISRRHRPRGKNRAGGRIYFRLLRRIFPHSLSQSDKSFGRAEAEASDCKSFGVKAADPHFGRLFLRPRLPHRFQPSRCHRAKSRKYHAHRRGAESQLRHELRPHFGVGRRRNHRHGKTCTAFGELSRISGNQQFADGRELR